MNGASPQQPGPGEGQTGEPNEIASALRVKADAWQFLVLGKVANFTVLRRRLGRERARALVSRLAHLIADLIPGARASVSAADLIEVEFEGGAREVLEGVIEALNWAFSRPVQLSGEDCEVDLLLGAAATRTATIDSLYLIEQAEWALDQTGFDRRSVCIDAGRDSSKVDRVALASDLGLAIDRDELFLQYQPKLHVREQRVTSVEALIRWRHPERGLVHPGDFIPLAEQTRAIMPVTLWTVRQALADQAVLARHGHDMRVFVNIAGALLSDAAFVSEVCTLAWGRSDKIGFEITETSMIRDPESAIANLKRLADFGIEIAIDDYGAGLSSLAYLKRLPARELKIDKLFVTQLTSSNRDPLIVRSTIDLAHALEMEVVAEGVETQAALALLSVMGCDMIQGFLISRPIELNALIAYLNDDRHTAAVEDSRATFNRLAATWKRG